MLPETHPLIEAATQPLADNAEQRLGAQEILGRNFDPDDPGVECATSRLQSAGRRKLQILLKISLWCLAAVALAVVVFSNMPAFRIAETILDFDLFDPIEKPSLPEGLDQEARLILGDPELSDLEQKRRLHKFAPENPAYFAEYALVFNSENGELPPRYFETAAQIAPDNGYFLYFAAGRLGSESFEKKYDSSRPRPKPRYAQGVRLRSLPREMEFDIKDQESFDKALALIAEASSFPSFETYSSQMIASRASLLPVHNIAEFLRSLVYSYGTASGLIHLRYVADLLSARAEQLSKSGRRDEFIELAAQREALIGHLFENPDVLLVGELVNRVIASATATNFLFAAERLELEELAKIYREESAAFRKFRDLRDIRSKKEPDFFPVEKMSMFTESTFPVVGSHVKNQIQVSAADFQPMRMAEHELLGKIGIFAVALCLPIAAGALLLFRRMFPPPIRLPAKRLSTVLGALDAVWILALGIALPVMVFLVVTRLTPLSGKQYGAQHFQLLFPLVHLVALLLSLLIAPAVVVRWRLMKRLAPLGLGDRFTIPVALVVLGMLLVWSLAALPGLMMFEISKRTLIALAATPALALCLIVAHALRSLTGKPEDRILQCSAAFAVLPSHALAMVALCLLTPIYSATERHWLEKETILRIDPDAQDLGAYEYKVAAQMRKETKEMLGLE